MMTDNLMIYLFYVQSDISKVFVGQTVRTN